MSLSKMTNKEIKRVGYATKALIGIRSIDVNIHDYTDTERMKECIDKAINNLQELKKLV